MSAEHGGENDALAQLLAAESFRHYWDSSDERQIDGAWVWGLCCECGEFVPGGEEEAHLAAAFAPLLPAGCDKRGPGGECVRDHEPCPDFPAAKAGDA
tara:strand:+ start:56 stop:349 length:294 start_codon:yes stop_codon:yes gene_type:complete